MLIGYWQQRIKIQLEARLDVDDYDESQLISIKVPATHLSYYNTSPEFERVNGSVNLDGVEYKYVKRRLYNDTLEWLCIPDQGAMQLRASANKIWNIPVKSTSSDPYLLTPPFVTHTPFALISPAFAYEEGYLPSITPRTDEQPPDSLA